MGPLSDTNTLLRLSQPDNPLCPVAKAAVNHFSGNGEKLYIVPQNLVEFWNAATRPPEARGGLGYSLDEAYDAVEELLSVFVLLRDVPAVHDEWQELVRTVGVRGVQVHDARLVACMKVHGLLRILTFNGRDFNRYPGIEVIDPRALADL